MSKPNLSENEFRKLLQGNLYYTRNEIDWYDKFARFGYLDPYNTLTNTREYIFFTKPDLHIFNNGDATNLNPEIANMPFFKDLHERYLDVLKQLQKSQDTSRPFMNLLTNSVKSGLDLPSIQASEIEGPANVYGDDIPYRAGSGTSDNNHEFSLEFEDTKYLEVYMLFKAWDEYARKKNKGGITPPDRNYILNKILHDQCSFYKIIVDNDNESIIFFAKGWGVYPKGVPREVFGDLSKDGGLKFSVSFNATFVEDMNPVIINEFNALTQAKDRKNIPIYDSQGKHINGKWATLPYIEYDINVGINPMPRYKLKWRE
ncbi:MAG: hypothetical protein ACRDD7_01220 [Peptostreptococcaceae bacterium]